MKKGISVIICCYNSSSRLPATLGYLSKQIVEDLAWEIIIVNNRSTDNTSEVAKFEWAKYNNPCPIQVVDQPIPGLCAARERGIDTANFEFIIFCDDDNWLSSSYIKQCFVLMHENVKVGIIGGQSSAYFEGQKPVWFDNYAIGYAVGKQAPESQIVNSRGHLWGAGLCIRKSVFLTLKNSGFKFLATGRTGVSLLSGEDTELCYWYRLAGYDLYYSEELHFTHWIPQDRLTIEYRDRLYRGIEYSSNLLSIYSDLFYFTNYHAPDRLIGRLKVVYLWIKYLFYFIRNKKFFSYSSLINLTQFAFNTSIKLDKKAYNLIKSYNRLSK